MKSSKNDFNTLLDTIVAIIAVFAIRSLLRDDSSHIVSKKGRAVLEDEDLVKQIEDRYEEMKDNSESVGEVHIKLPS